MVETFYSVLGVGPDADREAIVRAYREAVKSHHPDVSDSPDATERFKRLTTAKDVLADETERAKYDRLGHEAYVGRCDDCSGWAGDSTTESADGASTAAGETGTSSASRAARAYADGGTATAEATPRENPTRAASEATAASYYRPGERMHPGETTGGDAVSRIQSGGHWLLLDGVLLLSALATAWVILFWGSLSALSILLAVVLCVATLAATSIHVTARVLA